MPTFIKKIDTALIRIQQAAIVICMLSMVLLIFWQVIARYCLKISVPYAEELARLSIVWCIFIGATLGVRFEEHMRVDVLFKHFPRVVQLGVQVLIYLMLAALTVVMLRWGVSFFQVTAGDNTTTLGFGRNIFYLPTPVCGALMLVYTLGNGVRFIKDFFSGKNKPVKE